MSVTRIASRYAKSLIDLASEQGKLERVLEDIEYFKAAAENRDLYLLLKSPIINTTKKSQIFKELFGDKFDELTNAFLNIILNKNRETHLPEIANEFVQQYRVIKHISTVKLTTATPVTEETIDKIKKGLLKSSATSDNIEIETAVDPDLIGGFVVEFDDKLYDASVAHKLELLKKEFTKNEYEASY